MPEPADGTKTATTGFIIGLVRDLGFGGGILAVLFILVDKGPALVASINTINTENDRRYSEFTKTADARYAELIKTNNAWHTEERAKSEKFLQEWRVARAEQKAASAELKINLAKTQKAVEEVKKNDG